jgi:RHS repeat-associated protein
MLLSRRNLHFLKKKCGAAADRDLIVDAVESWTRTPMAIRIDSKWTEHVYTGSRLDAETGLADYGFRDYASHYARFTSVDPIRDGRNWFAYVAGDPVNRVDVWGLASSDASESVYGSVLETYVFGEYWHGPEPIGPGMRIIQAVRGSSAVFLAFNAVAVGRGIPVRSTVSALSKAGTAVSAAQYFLFEATMLFESAISGQPYTPRLSTLAHEFLSPAEYQMVEEMRP